MSIAPVYLAEILLELLELHALGRVASSALSGSERLHEWLWTLSSCPRRAPVREWLWKLARL